MRKFPIFTSQVRALVTFAVLFLFTATPSTAAETMPYPHLTGSDTIRTLVQHPAFRGFGWHLLTRDGDSAKESLPLSRIQSLPPYHGFVDTVALDQACYDAVGNSPDPGKAALVERINSLHGIRTVEAANELGLGSQRYGIVSLG